ncbi:MAG: MurR/RpiR family transcriptional regulator [Clostridia bacterium]|nr:MurR/RpiR family transcriptional regulator [Clostridia bacterium]
MAENIISKLKTNINFLTNVEKKIAALIIENPGEFITYSMHELVKKADVSQGSIINFSKKFVNGGFPELKLKIASDISKNGVEAFDIVNSTDSAKEVLRKNIQSCNMAFQFTDEANSEEVLLRVTEKILKAKKVEIYGVFRSAAVASDLYYQLLQLGIPASFVSDILTCSVSAQMLDKNSLVIAVSASGNTKDVVDAVRNAKENNAYVVALTSNINSPLAKMSDDVLIASAGGNSFSSSPTEIRMSQHLLNDTICAYIRSRIDGKNKERYIKLRNILNSHSVEEGEYE